MLNDLDFYRFSSNTTPNDQYFEQYCLAYGMWKSVWARTFKELDGQESMFSNDWTRQSVIHSVFNKNEPVGICFHRFVDFRNPSAVDDSYFSPWPTDAISGLTQEGTRIDVCSNFTISENARGSTLGFRLKDLLMALTVKELLNSNCDSMTGTMRVDKGMHNATYDVGAEILVPNIEFHNVPVDLVAFRKSKVFVNHENPCGIMADRLWENQKSATPSIKIAS